MQNLPMWLQIWVMAIIMTVGTVWLFITLDVAFGRVSKKFTVIWAIINAILAIAGTIIVAILFK